MARGVVPKFVTDIPEVAMAMEHFPAKTTSFQCLARVLRFIVTGREVIIVDEILLKLHMVLISMARVFGAFERLDQWVTGLQE